MTFELNRPIVEFVDVSLEEYLREGTHKLLNCLSFRCIANDRCWIVDSKSQHKRIFLYMIAGILPCVSGIVRVAGSVFQGLNPHFGIVPQGTLLQNANLRALILEFSGERKKEYVSSIFSNGYLAAYQHIAFSEVNSDIRTLYLLQLMKHTHPEIFLVESWVSSSDPSIQQECIDVFQSLVRSSSITISAVDSQRLMEGIDAREVSLASLQSEYSS